MFSLGELFQIPIAIAATATSDSSIKNGLSDKIAGMFDFMIGQIPSWIAAFLVFGLSIFIAKLAKSAVESRISDKIDEEHQEVLVVSGRITYVVVLTIGITAALKIAGLDLTTILAAVAFGVGFALRAFIANFFAGVYILMSRQFAIGDFIQIGSLVGRVEEIQSRATILKTYDGYKVIVPNLDIFTKQVTSLTTNPVRRLKIPLYISYDEDINYAMKIALRIMKKHPKILKKPTPSVIVSNYGDSTIDLAARCWVESRGGWFKIKSDLLHMLWDGFMKAGIQVPYNIMHVENEQDTLAYKKEFQEIEKAHKEKMKLAREKKKAEAAVAQTPIPSANGTPIQQNGQPVFNPQTVAATIPNEPPSMYAQLEESDQNG